METYLVKGNAEVGYTGTTPPPPPPSQSTVFGYNVENTGNQTLAARQSWWGGRAPCVRKYNSGRMPASFDQTTAACPEKRVCYSFKEGGDLPGLAAGNYNATMTSYLNSIPAGWTVFWVFHHEPNTGTAMEIDATQYVQVYHQMRLCLNAASLASGTHVYITSNFQHITGMTWSDTWVPAKADMDILTWDLYGNPGYNTSTSGSNQYGGPATGKLYGTTYPDVATRLSSMFTITDRVGMASSWGILEFNTPSRDWDTSENGKALWHQDYINTCMNPPMTGNNPPKIMLAWEAIDGVQFDQSYGKVSGNPLTVANVIKPYMVASP